jgi:hypothetical protein
VVCGTSEATPLFAGIVAIAGQYAGHDLGFINPALYELSADGAPGIVDCRGGPRPPSPSMIDLNHRRLCGGLRRRRDRAVIVAVVTEPTIEVCPISIFCCPRPTCV